MNAKELAYERIKENIVNCVYMPGDVLSENEIKNQIDVGRTPIREALSKLENEHLVRIYPKRGIFVTNITVKDVSSIYGIREVLEPYAVGLCMPHIPKEKLEEFERLYKIALECQESKDDLLDKQFHYMIYENTDNQYLCDMLKRIYDQNTRIRILSTIKNNNRRRNTYAEHLSILAAMLDQDVGRAKAQMKKHVVTGWRVALTVTE